jgi:hypothetical protein
MTGIGPWLDDWPGAFLDFARSKAVRWSDLVRRDGQMPYWLHRIGREYLLQKAAPIGHAEAEAIAEHAARAHERRTCGLTGQQAPARTQQAPSLTCELRSTVRAHRSPDRRPA